MILGDVGAGGIQLPRGRGCQGDAGTREMWYQGDTGTRGMQVPGLWAPGGCGHQGIWTSGTTEVLGGGLCLSMPPEQEGTQRGHPGGCSGDAEPPLSGALVGGWGYCCRGTAPGVLASLGDLGRDDFMALLRTNFHPGRENKPAGPACAMESYWGRGEFSRAMGSLAGPRGVRGCFHTRPGFLHLPPRDDNL